MPLPKTSTLIRNIERDKDARGGILSICDEPVQNVSIISCTAGSIRSNHYHHENFHFMYVLEGEIDYFYRDVVSAEMRYLKVRKGESIFTPAKELHATYFPVATELIVSSRMPRDQAAYERDTVREKLVTEENLKEALARFT